MDDSTILGVLYESDSSVIIYMGHRIGTFVPVFAMFAIRILLDENSVSVVIRDSRSIFSYEILLDKYLFSALDVGPVGFEADVVDVTAAEHELGWCRLRGGMNRCTHAESDGGEDATPRVFDREVVLILDLFGRDYIV